MPDSFDDLQVSVVIPNYNGGDLLKRCLAALLEDVTPGLEVIVVDNGSTDGSPDAAAADRRVRVLRNLRNLGFAAACNQGALAAKSPLLLFLNNDARISGPQVRALCNSMEEPRLAAVQPVMLRDNGSGSVDSAGSQFTWTGFLRHNREAPKATGLVPVFAAKGACMLVRAMDFHHVGGFDDSYFAYFEDSDLCWKLRMAGSWVAVDPRVVAFHDTGGTTRRFFPAAHIDYLSFRNRIRSILANLERRTLVVVLPLHMAACLGTVLAFLIGRRPASALAILRAMAWPIANAAAVRGARRRVVVFRCVSDRDLFTAQVTAPMRPQDAAALLRAYLPRW